MELMRTLPNLVGISPTPRGQPGAQHLSLGNLPGPRHHCQRSVSLPSWHCKQRGALSRPDRLALELVSRRGKGRRHLFRRQARGPDHGRGLLAGNRKPSGYRLFGGRILAPESGRKRPRCLPARRHLGGIAGKIVDPLLEGVTIRKHPVTRPIGGGLRLRNYPQLSARIF